ncbi:MAG TPA: VWA domain-containing protein [Vicinamibacterales bacterium]|nr:VWA domain-containing protein [Vicinamibacterales bacterium]
MVVVAFVAFVAPPWRVSPHAQQPTPAQPPTQAQQKPVFRGGTHFVRVDAYPTSKDGHIVEGLKAEDFEITEDGKPQTIESFDYISFPSFTPDAERHDPESQRAGFDLAADPRYRVFVILVDMRYGGGHAGAVVETKGDFGSIQSPLVNFLDRVLGPQDLFGFLTSRNTAKDLVLGQRSVSVKGQIEDLFRVSMIERDEADALDACRNGPALKDRFRLDQTYTALEGLVTQLGSLRDERKNIIFVTNRLPHPREDRALLDATGGPMPRAGIMKGRVGIGDHQLGANDSFCAGESQRLSMMDFDPRYKDLLRSAKHENVTFYAITPAGLQAPVTVAERDAVTRANDDLITLAHETDGIAIVDTNDLSGGMKKIGDDLASYYVLGYYTTNTTWDGGIRTIKVKVKPSSQTIRARRQYRAPTQAEIDALAARPAGGASVAAAPTDRETALAILERAARPFATYTALKGDTLTIVMELTPSSIQNARWKSGADVQITASTPEGTTLMTTRGRIEAGAYSAVVPLTIDLSRPPARIAIDLTAPGERPANDWLNLPRAGRTLVGDPIAYRSASRVAQRPVAAFEFARNERIKVEWPVLASSLDRREARLLDHAGKPLPVDLPLSEDPARKIVALDVSLSGLPRGDYLFELTVGAGAVTERHLLAIRIRP